MSVDATEGIRVSLRLLVSHAPEQRFTDSGAETLQVRGSVVDASRVHPQVVVRFSGKHAAELYRWAQPGKHLDVEGHLEVKSWTTAEHKTRIALLVEARDIFPLNADQPDLSKVGITTRTTTGRPPTRRAADDGGGVVKVRKGAKDVDVLRQLLADA